MTANKVRADYEILQQIAQTFSQQADATRQTLKQLRQTMSVLQERDWVGKGADKFYSEMTTAVLPSITRLQTALENASRVTKQISNVMKQAEEEAARVLKGGGNGVTGTSVLDGGSSAAFGGLIGGFSGGSSGGSSGESSGGGSGSAAGTATSRMLSNLDPKVAEIAEKSPTLKAQLEMLEKNGWTIVKGQGTYTDEENKRIVIDTGANTKAEYQVGAVAHEYWHALNKTRRAGNSLMTRQQYVDANVKEQLLGEGACELNKYTVRDEIMAERGPDIREPRESPDYAKAYEDYKAGTIKHADAIQKMSDLMAKENTSTTHEPYEDYYRKKAESYYDEYIAPRILTP